MYNTSPPPGAAYSKAIADKVKAKAAPRQRTTKIPKAAPTSMIAAIADAKVVKDMPLWERRAQVCAMRKMGYLYSEIAEKFGMSEAAVQKDVRAVYKEVMADHLEDMIARQRTVIFDLQRANYAAALERDYDAQKQIMAGLDHEARLFGLYAPARVAVGISTEDFAERAVTLIESLGLEPPRELTAAMRPAEHNGHRVIDAEEFSENGETPSN